MTKPLLYDLFCKAGGCSKGYMDAGFYVIGVDINPQPRYIGDEFVQMDALEFLQQLLDGLWPEPTAITASPPCQFGTGVQNLGKARNGNYPIHLNLIPQTRELLIKTGKPYVIENVAGARKHLINPTMICGSQFDLKVYRHRYFESNVFLQSCPHYPHKDSTPSAGNGKSPKGFISVCGTGGVRGMKAQEIVEYWSMAMGIDWMNRAELAEAIPPAYTRFIGEQLMRVIT